MGEIYTHFESICELLGEKVQNIITEPLFWVMMFLLLCCMVLTYSGASQGRLSNSIVNTLRQLGSFFIDTFNSIVQAVKNLFGFLDVLRQLFFGHLGQSTIYVLTNYAIIFLSMASFATTMQGMFSLISWTGILISFGVQVMELVAVMGLVLCLVPPKGKLKEAVTYTYCLPNEHQPCDDEKNNEKAAEMLDEEIKQLKNRHKTGYQKVYTFWWGRFRRKALPVVLLLAYSSSVFFSYCYMFNAIVMPEIAYDDYMESIDLVMKRTEEFEQTLTTYRADLVQGLSRLNDEVSANFAERNFPTLESALQTAQNDYEAAERTVNSTWQAAQGVVGTPDYEDAFRRYQNAADQLEAISKRRNALIAERDSNDYAIFQTIQRLSDYYADPLYLRRIAEGGSVNEVAESVNRDFNTVLSQAFNTNRTTPLAASEDVLRIAFDNFTSLAKYYAEHGESGLDLSGEGGVEFLLERRADILSEYNNLKNPPLDSDSESTASERQKAANSYLNGETGKLLIAAMQALEKVPQFSTVGTLWQGTDVSIIPTEPIVSEYLTQFNQKYRASNGQLSLQERAIFKLSAPNSATAWFSLIMAATLDGMIIILCCIRERKYYTNNARSRRQMAAMLFVIPCTEEELERNEQGRRMILSGTVLGCLIYLLYFKLFPNGGASNAIEAFVLIIFGIMLMALLGALRNTFQKTKPVPALDLCKGTKELEKESNSEADPIRTRLTAPALKLFKNGLKCDYFQKCCSMRRPKAQAERQGADYYQREKMLWHLKEDYKIRTYVLSHRDYETVVTSCSKNMEYYVKKTQVEECGLMIQFAILLSHGLVYPVKVPVQTGVSNDKSGNNQSTAIGSTASAGPDTETAYILTKDFIRLIYECIMLRTIGGNNWEYGMEDDLLDYEREDDGDEE